LTAAVLAGSESEAGIASGVNNAVARVASLLGTAAVGAAIASSFASRMESRLSGTPLGASARAAVARAKRLPLGLPDLHGVPAAQARGRRAQAPAARTPRCARRARGAGASGDACRRSGLAAQLSPRARDSG